MQSQAEETAAHWVIKLCILKILLGIKLGRQERHADAWLSRGFAKHGPTWSDGLQLKEHLKLVQVAKAMSIDHIAGLQNEELEAYLVQLAHFELPPSLKEQLLLRRVASLHKSCDVQSATGDQSVYEELATCLLPPCELTLNTFGPKHPTLAGLADHRPCRDLRALFLKLMFKQIVIPAVGAGSASSEFVMRFSKVVVRKMEAAMDSVSDEWAETFFDSLTALRSCVAVLTPGIPSATADSELEDVESSALKRGIDTMIAQFAKVWNNTSFYCEATTRYWKKAVGLKAHATLLTRWEQPDLDEDLRTLVPQLMVMCKDMCVLLATFAAKDLTAYLRRCEVAVCVASKKAREAVASAAGTASTNADLLLQTQLMLTEVGKVIAIGPIILEERRLVGALLQGAMVADASQQLDDVLGNFSGRDVADWIEKFDKAIKVVPVPSNRGRTLATSVCSGLILLIRDKDESSECVDARVLLGAAGRVSQFCDTADATKHKSLIKLMSMSLELCDLTDDYESLGKSIAVRCNSDTGHQKITGMIRGKQRLEECWKENSAAYSAEWLRTHTGDIPCLIQLASDHVQKAGNYVCKLQSGALVASARQLQKFAGGASDGSLWHADLIEGATYDAIEEIAKVQLLGQDGPAIVKLVKAVTKDRLPLNPKTLKP